SLSLREREEVQTLLRRLSGGSNGDAAPEPASLQRPSGKPSALQRRRSAKSERAGGGVRVLRSVQRQHGYAALAAAVASSGRRGTLLLDGAPFRLFHCGEFGKRFFERHHLAALGGVIAA